MTRKIMLARFMASISVKEPNFWTLQTPHVRQHPRKLPTRPMESPQASQPGDITHVTSGHFGREYFPILSALANKAPLESDAFRWLTGRKVEDIEDCATCAIRQFCGAPCPAKAHEMNGGMKQKGAFCAFYKRRLRNSQPGAFRNSAPVCSSCCLTEHCRAGASGASCAGAGVRAGRRIALAALRWGSDQRQLLLQIGAAAGRADRLLAGAHKRLEGLAAFLALIAVDRHSMTSII